MSLNLITAAIGSHMDGIITSAIESHMDEINHTDYGKEDANIPQPQTPPSGVSVTNIPSSSVNSTPR